MKNKTIWVLTCVAILGAGLMATSLANPPVVAADKGYPPLEVGDTYWFGLTGGSPLSGPVVALGTYPWVGVKVDNNDANVYMINLDHVIRIKRLSK